MMATGLAGQQLLTSQQVISGDRGSLQTVGIVFLLIGVQDLMLQCLYSV